MKRFILLIFLATVTLGGCTAASFDSPSGDRHHSPFGLDDNKRG